MTHRALAALGRAGPVPHPGNRGELALVGRGVGKLVSGFDATLAISGSQESCPHGHEFRRASPSPAAALGRPASYLHSTTELTLVVEVEVKQPQRKEQG